MNKFPYDYKQEVFGNIIFMNREGNLDTVKRNEILVQNKITGEYSKWDMRVFVGLINKFFTRDERRELLKEMF